MSTMTAKTTNSRAYLAAIDSHNEASAAFRKIRDAYRAKQASDLEFLAARDAFTRATEVYDAAFSEEAHRQTSS